MRIAIIVLLVPLSAYAVPPLTKAEECLAKNIYFEARNSSLQDMIAVSLVVLNRVKSNKYPGTICGVVWQRSDRAAQFSWTLDNKPDIPTNQDAWEVAALVASSLVAEGTMDHLDDFTRGSTNYHAYYVKPSWSSRLERVAMFGFHIFYRERSRRQEIGAITQRGENDER